MRKALLFTFIVLNYSTLFSQSQLIFSDQFDNNAKSWSIKNETDYGAELSGGAYHLNLRKDTWTWYVYSSLALNPTKPFKIETEFKFTTGSTSKSTFGLAWNVKDKDNNLVFEISRDGKYAFYKKENATKTYVKDKAFMGKVIPNNESHKLTVNYDGKEYHFLLDGNEVFTSAYIAVLYDNYVGFYVEHKVNVSIDYLQVYQDRPQLNTIDASEFEKIEKINLGSKINTIYTEKRPIISSDGKTLYFTREGDPKNIGDPEADDIWVADLGPDGLWGEAYNIGRPLNNKDNNSMVGVAKDNSWMVLKTVYTPDGEYKEKGFSISHKVNGKWSVPERIDVKNFYNKNKYQEACINPDGTVLIFTIEREDTYGGKDVYFSKKQSDGSWSEPKNCGAVLNSFGDEIGPFMAGDGKTMYFASEGHPGYGDADVFMSKRLDDTWTNWSTPVNLGPQINTSGWDAYFSTDIKGEWGYMVSNQNSIGKLDIFKFKLPEKAKPEISFTIKGLVVNATSKEPMIGKVQLKKLDNDSLITEVFAGSVDGKFEFVVKEGVEYAIVGDYPGYIGERKTVSFVGLEESDEREVTINLKQVVKEQTIQLNTIFFADDKAELLYTSKSELHHVANLMKDNPKMEIVINGHAMKTEMGDKYDMKLSKARAKTVYKYLLDLGISKKRMKYTAKGSTDQLYGEDAKEGLKGNRCVSFTITKME